MNAHENWAGTQPLANLTRKHARPRFYVTSAFSAVILVCVIVIIHIRF
jgi:hypothetical protein